MQKCIRKMFVGAALVAMFATPALAADQLIPGKIMIVKPGTLAKVLAKGTFVLPAGADDPTTLLMDQAADAILAASSPAALVDRYSLLLMGGQMSPFMRGILVVRLNQMSTDDYDDLGRARVQEALYLILTSPEYSIQK